MSKRSVHLTVIAFLLIGWGGVRLLLGAATLIGGSGPRPGPGSTLLVVPYISYYLFWAVSVLCGVGVLRGYYWTRTLFLVYGSIHYAVVFMYYPIRFLVTAKTLILIAMFLGICIVLFLPERGRAVKGADESEGSRRDPKWHGSRTIGILVSLFPLPYIFLQSMYGGSSLPFDIMRLDLSRALFEGIPLPNGLVIWACTIPATIFFYGRMKDHRNAVYLCLLNLVIAPLYLTAISLSSVVLFFGMFAIFGPM